MQIFTTSILDIKQKSHLFMTNILNINIEKNKLSKHAVITTHEVSSATRELINIAEKQQLTLRRFRFILVSI